MLEPKKSALIKPITSSVGSTPPKKALLSAGTRSTSITRPDSKVTALAQKVFAEVSAARKPKESGRLAFVIDATGSREHSWEESQKAQAKMFATATKYGEMILGIGYHSGGHAKNLGWFDDTKRAAAAMAPVSCSTGSTQIVDTISFFITENKDKTPSSLILVGDAFEESSYALEAVAERLKTQGTKVYAFLEGNNKNTAEAFKRIAEITGGAFFKFPPPGTSFDDICEVIVARTVGGEDAFLKLLRKGNRAAQLIDAQEPKKLGHDSFSPNPSSV